MKTLILLFLIISIIGCNKTKDDVIASKCRLKLPIIKSECEAVGVYNTKGGQLKGLPVSNRE